MLLSVSFPLRIFLVLVSFQFWRKGSVFSLLFTVILIPLLLLFQFLFAMFSNQILIVIALSTSSINNILLYECSTFAYQGLLNLRPLLFRLPGKAHQLFMKPFPIIFNSETLVY